METEEIYSSIRFRGEKVIMETTRRQMKGKFIRISLSLLPLVVLSGQAKEEQAGIGWLT
jgi:hypothetical protein